MKLKIASLILAAIMILSCLSGCGSLTPPAASESSDAVSEPVSSEGVEEPTVDADANAAMFQAAYEKYSPDTVVMTVNGTEVTWDRYYPWLYAIASQLAATGTPVDWSAALDSTFTNQSYSRYYAENMAAQYVIVENEANSLGLELTDDQKDKLQAIKESDIANYVSDDSTFEDYLKSVYITEDYYDYINSISMLYYSIFGYYYGESAEKVSDKDTLAFAEDSGYMHAKHILFSTVDDEGNPLSDEEIAAKRAAAEDALSKLKSASPTGEKLSLFDTLIAELSEDPGSTYYPNGYYFVPGDMVEPFETAVAGLEENAISDIVETDYGFHIILRLPLNPDDDVDYDSEGTMRSLRYFTALSLFSTMSDEWFTTVDVQYADGFKDLDFDVLFGE